MFQKRLNTTAVSPPAVSLAPLRGGYADGGERRARTAARLQVTAKLTCVCHGEATARIHHVHLRNQLGEVLVLRESEAEHLIFMRTRWEQPPCEEHEGISSHPSKIGFGYIVDSNIAYPIVLKDTRILQPIV